MHVKYKASLYSKFNHPTIEKLKLTPQPATTRNLSQMLLQMIRV